MDAILSPIALIQSSGFVVPTTGGFRGGIKLGFVFNSSENLSKPSMILSVIVFINYFHGSTTILSTCTPSKLSK